MEGQPDECRLAGAGGAQACPVIALVELQGVERPNSATDRLRLHRIVERRAGAMQIDVGDVLRAQGCFSPGPVRIACERALAFGIGRADVMRVGALAAPEQCHRRLVARHQEGRGPSPILMPSRLRLNGIAQAAGTWPRATRSRETVMRHSVSAPPTITASQTPASIRRRPEAKTLALAEQAVAIV